MAGRTRLNMTEYNLYKLLHVASVAFYAGALLAVISVQSLLQRALDDAERKSLARTAYSIARLIVRPFAYAGFLAGLVFWIAWYGRMAGGKLMACTPIYVHTMLLFGFLAVGMTDAWRAQLRRLSQGLDEGKPFVELRKFLSKGWVFAFLALALTSATFAVAILKIPNPPLRNCAPQQTSER